MPKSNNESRYADTPVSPAVETSVVHSFREEVTLLGNRRICDEAPNSNPLGRLDADGVLPKTSEALLVIKGKSSKRRIKRKKKAEQEERKTKARKESKKKVNRNTLRLATWNVRTMTTGSSDDLTEITDFRKTAAIDLEFKRLGIDIAALQETRLLDSGTKREENFTFFWKGKGMEERREHGVGFAVNNKLLSKIEEPSGGTERLLTLRLNTAHGPTNLQTSSVSTHPRTAQKMTRKTDSMKNWTRLSENPQALNRSSSWEISTQELVQTMSPGANVLVSMGQGR